MLILYWDPKAELSFYKTASELRLSFLWLRVVKTRTAVNTSSKKYPDLLEIKNLASHLAFQIANSATLGARCNPPVTSYVDDWRVMVKALRFEPHWAEYNCLSLVGALVNAPPADVSPFFQQEFEPIWRLFLSGVYSNREGACDVLGLMQTLKWVHLLSLDIQQDLLNRLQPSSSTLALKFPSLESDLLFSLNGR